MEEKVQQAEEKDYVEQRKERGSDGDRAIK